MSIGQQYLQNVLGYDTLEAGAAILPAVVFMVLIAPRSAKLLDSHGSRFTLLVGYVFVVLRFLTMLLLWTELEVLGDRFGLGLYGSRCRVRGDTCLTLLDRLGTSTARRHGIWHR